MQTLILEIVFFVISLKRLLMTDIKIGMRNQILCNVLFSKSVYARFSLIIYTYIKFVSLFVRFFKL